MRVKLVRVKVKMTEKCPEEAGQEEELEFLPRAMSAADFLAARRVPIHSNKRKVLNLLAMSSFLPNPVPGFLGGLAAYDLLRNVSLAEMSEKEVVNPLGSCLAFALYALASAMSWWQVDQHGVITMASVHLGSKLWISCPGMPIRKVRSWGRRPATWDGEGMAPMPRWAYVGIHLAPIS